MHKQQQKAISSRLVLLIIVITLFIFAASYYQFSKTLEGLAREKRLRNNNNDKENDHHDVNQFDEGEENNKVNNKNDDHINVNHMENVVDLNNLNPNHQHENHQDFKNAKQQLQIDKTENAVSKISHRLIKALLNDNNKKATTASSSSSTLLEKENRNLDLMVSKKIPIENFMDPDVELFVIWYDALHVADKILQDIRQRFYVVAIDYFDWNKDKMDKHRFETNLWRLYSGKGGWERKGMAKKVVQCGYGPFIALVVIDPKPVYQDEQTAHGIDRVNHNMNAAKKRYRKWAGGGFKVHGTFGRQEAEHDIPILFHRSRSDFGEDLRVAMVDAYGKSPLVDGFVRAMLSIGDGDASSSASYDKSKFSYNPMRIVFENPRDPWRELRPTSPLHKSGPCRSKEKWVLDSAFKKDSLENQQLLHSRDHLFENNFVTTRQTFGMDGFQTCRDFLLMMTPFFELGESNGINSIIGKLKTKDGDAEKLTLAELECRPCASWPTDLEIVLNDEDVRWAVASLVASSASSNIYEETDTRHEGKPIGFDGVVFHTGDVAATGDEILTKKMRIIIKPVSTG